MSKTRNPVTATKKDGEETGRKPVTTAGQIESLKPEDKPYTLRCKKHAGLYVRVHPSGSKAFYFRHKGKWKHLGEFGKPAAGQLSLADAGDEVNRLRVILKEYGSLEAHALIESKKRETELSEIRAEQDQKSLSVEKLCRKYCDHISREIKTGI